MDEARHRWWDIVFKWIGLIALILSAMWTVHKYSQDRSDEFNKEQDARKADRASFLFQRQAALYFDASRAAATLASPADAKQRAEAQTRFEQLYWGELVVVEDRRVELAMIAFHRCLESNGKSCKRASERQDGSKLDDPNTFGLLELSLDLGACTRRSLREAWGVAFQDVLDPKNALSREGPPITTCPYDSDSGNAK